MCIIGVCDGFLFYLPTMIRFHLFDFGEFEAPRRVGPACWAHFDLLWVHEGRLRLSVGGREVRLETAEGVLIYPDTPFDGETLVPVTRASAQHFEMTDPDAGGLLEPYRRLRGRRRGCEVYRAQNPAAFDRDVQRAVALAHEPQTPMVHALHVAQMALILGTLYETRRAGGDLRPGGRARFRKLIPWLQQRLHEPVTLDEMAQRVDLSPSHFRALFRGAFGMAPGAYLIHLRMQEAARLLRQTGMPIKQVARRVGYEELANFYRAFKAAHGETPARYRRRHPPLA